ADLTHNMDLSRLAKVTEKDIARQQKYQQAKLFLLT
ncbi:guanosine-3',5'-bis(diphosphate) 3'-pyrophosphohydrolase, partial [Glaesserella parasuis]|nr:guanosine-3',5'-bis(diphosphate) 3'-pyrophosphohydrolase [Glaesserella parasuis]MDE3932362.1 guanosine-3',5'-bis(diphosphate) 3'-pyrophosphohydrolase [Glaesserella parasuis]MDE3936392.1 guanosine-3',5'-bis(diphosphate) 3'-pyrophosphohydrolase [Glaesserella parasuis]MDE3936784.1 guanosine-3',5'-bis(diphosphate) 3'-pyrophosphohydrolase [Glaesserella parasuis]MDE3938599.1 guanosine-3',5'-bis(diphosphate) 3'-pyrophosphohydrolase [Glaesserella parasuis]